MLILASQSPRRAQLLREAGIDFIIRAREVNEDFPTDLAADEVAPYLARRKAEASLDLLGVAGDVLLTADSTVILGETIYNKPADRTDAQRILRALSGRTHRVVTGCCLLSLEKEEVFSGISHVTFTELSDAEIDYYIDHYQPYDKAGAYAIQEWIGLCKVSRIEGTYANIVGLPVDLVYERLQRFR
jgi:septum formation protein